MPRSQRGFLRGRPESVTVTRPGERSTTAETVAVQAKPLLSVTGDEGAGEVVGEAVGGGSGQGGSPAVVEAAGPPAGDRLGRRGICVRGEVALEGFCEDLAGPG